jgi:hypothetical protein
MQKPPGFHPGGSRVCPCKSAAGTSAVSDPLKDAKRINL